MRASSAAPTRPRLSLLSGTWMVTMSARSKSSAFSMRLTPSSAARASVRLRLQPISSSPKAWPVLATIVPNRPRPMMPSVLPWALADGAILARDVAQEREDQSPGQLGRRIADALGAAINDAALGQGGGIDRGVVHAGGDHQPQIGQLVDQRARQGRALARQHQALEGVEALGQRVDIGDVLRKGLDLRLGMKALPIRKPQCHGEIVVENRDAQHDRQPPARMDRQVLL